MHRIDNATSAAALPTPQPVGPNPNSYFQPQAIVEADWLNSIQEEVAAVVESEGIALNKTLRNQLLAAITNKIISIATDYAAGGDFYADSGGSNAYLLSVVGTHVAPPGYFMGMRIRFIPDNDCYAASTVNVAGLGVKNLIDDRFGSALSSGALRAGVQATAYYDGTSFRVVAMPREALNQYIYDGSNYYLNETVESALYEVGTRWMYFARADGTPSMNVFVNAGKLLVNGAVVSNAQQGVVITAADVTNPRIDRITISPTTGVCTLTTGTPAGSPVAPAIPAGQLPICQISVPANDTTISLTQITDERALYVDAGDRVLIETVTSASPVAELAFASGGISTAYRQFEIVVTMKPNTNGESIQCQLGDGGGWFATTYEHVTGQAWTAATAQTHFPLSGAATGTSAEIDGIMRILQPHSVGQWAILWDGTYIDSGLSELRQYKLSGRRGNSAITRARFYASAGNVIGSIRLYGIR